MDHDNFRVSKIASVERKGGGRGVEGEKERRERRERRDGRDGRDGRERRFRLCIDIFEIDQK